MTIEQAKNLHYGDIVWSTGSRWRVNGMVKTWKRDAARISVPIKHGLYSYGYITEHNVADFSLEVDEP